MTDDSHLTRKSSVQSGQGMHGGLSFFGVDIQAPEAIIDLDPRDTWIDRQVPDLS